MRLIDLIIAQQQEHFAAALTAIGDRGRDIDTVDRLAGALRGRGWNAQANVTTEPLGGAARCNLWLHVSTTADELADMLDFLGADGVTASRIIHHEQRTLRHYSLRLRDCTVQLYAYVHAARAAA